MFDIDSGKLLIVAVLALIVIGPKELPRVLRQVGQAVGKMRRMASEFQGQFMDAMKEADIADIRKELDEFNKTAALDYNFDPVRDVQSEITKTFNDTGLTKSLEPVTGVAPVEVASPAAGFELPQLEAAASTPAAEGIAPESPSEPESITVEPASAPVSRGPKRKVLVKKRRSTFKVLRNEDAAWATGEAFQTRSRAVRPKTLADSDATPA